MKKSLALLLITILSSLTLYAQVQDIIPVTSYHSNIKESVPILLNSNDLMIVYVNSTQDSLFSIRSTDNGISWKAPNFIQVIQLTENQELIHLAGLKTNTGRILIVWSEFRKAVISTYSDDNGISWSQKIILPGEVNLTASMLNISQLHNNNIILTSRDVRIPSPVRMVFRMSTNNGVTWSDPVVMKDSLGNNITAVSEFAYVSKDANNVFGIMLKSATGLKTIFRLSAGNSDLNKPNISEILQTSENISRTKLLKTADNNLWIVYQMISPTSYHNFSQHDIYYIKSSDGGNNWSQPVRFTNYLGNDHSHNITDFNNNLLISFASQRFTNRNQIALGQIGLSIDSEYPPFIISSTVASLDIENQTINVKSTIIHDKKDFDVEVFLPGNHFIGSLYDDGQHNDQEADDFIYGNDFSFADFPSTRNYLMDINNIKLPVSSNGVMSDVVPTIDIELLIKINYKNLTIISDETEFHQSMGSWGAQYDGIGFLFSSGLVLSGLDNGEAWANTANSFNPRRDYIPGPVGSSVNDPLNRFYVVRTDDPPFGSSWQNWRYAVELGADFYDGDGDGIYNPVDRNMNGTWDPDEDMPLIIGDATVWFVYNDGVPDSQKTWLSKPKQIEVAQTLFASNKPGFENIVFIRFAVKNKSENVYDSVYFGIWADPDIGENFQEDLVGCDTLLNSGFAYKYGTDPAFGVNPPAFFTTILQGPVVTSDLNSDTAYIRLGQQIGQSALASAYNLGLTSHLAGLKSLNPDFRDPDNINTVRNYFRGLSRSGQIVDPCTFTVGEVHGGVDCSQINPVFMFSGDPVQPLGWILKQPWDIRNMVSSGPFTLNPNQSQDILMAYVVGRGSDNLNSITVTRDFVSKAIEEYNINFSSLAYVPPPPTNPPVSYILYQNYPNPFNPYTTIRIEMPEDGFVTLKVYDILGREVKTILNEFRKSNRFEIRFDGSNLASGVYFYQLIVNNFIETKKMILLR